MTFIELSSDKVEKLKEVVNRYPEITFLAIIGSLAKRGFSTHDVDIAVKVCSRDRNEKYDILVALVSEIAIVLNVPGEHIDIIDLDRADLEIKAEVLRSSIVIIDRGYLKELIKEVEKTYPEYSEYRDLSIREWLASNDSTTIDMKLLKRRFDFIRSEIRFLQEHVLCKTLEEVKSSPILTRVLERSYQLIVEAMIYIARHIVSVMGWGPCFSASEYIDKLSQHGAIPRELAENITKRIKLRNIIVHRYLEVDYDMLYRDTYKLIELAREFEKHIVEFLKKILGQGIEHFRPG